MNTKLSKKMAVGLGLACLVPWLALSQSNYEPYTFTTIAGKAGSSGSADGNNSAARFNWPVGVAVDRAGNLYVTEWNNHTIRKVTPVGTNWMVTTLAGKAGSSGSADGTNTAARLNYPCGVAMDGAGNLYVSDVGNSTIRKVTPTGTNWVVTTLAGKTGSSGWADGTNSTAQFNGGWYIAVDNAGNLYVADFLNDTIRKVTPVGTDWVVTTLAGKVGSPGSADGAGIAARFHFYDPSAGGGGGLAVDSEGTLYVAEWYYNTIRKGYRPLEIASTETSFGFRSGQFGFALTGPAGQSVVVDFSTDLLNWLPVWTNTFMVGALQFSDPDSGVYPNRFYRARRP